MSEFIDNSDFISNDDSTATMEPFTSANDPGLLDQLARKLNAAPLKTEPIDFNRMQQLETRLADREQLVSILTDRLEQAADELDRIKRSGGVLAQSNSDGDDTASLMAGQTEVASKLDRFVEAWEERYEGPALRRMEASIEELRERLEQAAMQNPWAKQDQPQPFSQQDDSADDLSLDQSDVLAASSEPPRPRRPLDAPIQLVLISSDAVPDDLDVPIPEPVADQEVPESDLRKAVADRDAYIRWLCQRMREITGRLEAWLGELQTESDDEALHRRVDELEKLIHEQLRVAEIDISIERARLSRDQAQLREQAERLAREREKMAKPVNPTNEPEDSPLLRRWKKFLTSQDA